MATDSLSHNPGWVYVLTNPAMPDLVKIGLTTRNPSVRTAELTAATGVPAPFVIAWCRAVSDCGAVESVVHRMLDDRRVHDRREFFRCDVRTARQVIEAGAGGKLGRRYRTPRPSGRRSGRRRSRRLQGGDFTALALLAGVVALLVLLLLKPPVAWLPGPLAQIAATIESL